MTLIVLEGLDFTGKTTTIKQVLPLLKSKYPDKKIHLFKEPGDTTVGEEIRTQLFQHGANMSPQTKLDLFLTARRALIKEKLIPLLENGDIVILDRYIASTIAYQGAGDQIGIDNVTNQIQQLLNEFPALVKPNLTLYFQIPEYTRLQRMSKDQQNQLDQYNQQFYKRVKNAYPHAIQTTSHDIAYVDAQGTITDSANQVATIIINFIKKETENA